MNSDRGNFIDVPLGLRPGKPPNGLARHLEFVRLPPEASHQRGESLGVADMLTLSVNTQEFAE